MSKQEQHFPDIWNNISGLYSNKRKRPCLCKVNYLLLSQEALELCHINKRSCIVISKNYAYPQILSANLSPRNVNIGFQKLFFALKSFCKTHLLCCFKWIVGIIQLRLWLHFVIDSGREISKIREICLPFMVWGEDVSTLIVLKRFTYWSSR